MQVAMVCADSDVFMSALPTSILVKMILQGPPGTRERLWKPYGFISNAL